MRDDASEGGVSEAPLTVCPNCGHSLSREASLTDGDFRYEFRTGLYYRGDIVPLTPARHRLAGILMRATGRTLPVDAILLGLRWEDAESGANLIAVHVCKIRAAMARAGIPCPLQTVHSRGYRWAPGSDNPPPQLGRGGRPAHADRSALVPA